MKLKYLIGLLFLILFACSTGDDSTNLISEEEEQEVENQAPTATSLIFPTNELICSGINLEFQWEAASDPEGDDIIYEVSIATDANFNSIVHSNKTVLTSRTHNLENATTYYWRVRTLDSEENVSDYSPTWDFYTEREAEFNTLPTLPTVLLPELGSTVNATSVNLSWEASDADGDELSYDVYMGKTNPPALHIENTTATNLEITVDTGSTYYWKVIVKDTKGGIAYGELWNFKTQ